MHVIRITNGPLTVVYCLEIKNVFYGFVFVSGWTEYCVGLHVFFLNLFILDYKNKTNNYNESLLDSHEFHNHKFVVYLCLF